MENDAQISPVDAATKARYRRLNKAAELLPDERIADCCRKVKPTVQQVTGYYDPDRQRSSLIGHITCDSAACPICGYRRAEESRHELALALAQASKKSLHVIMITATVQHHPGHTLDELRKALTKAWNKTFSGRWYDGLCEEYLIEGKLRSWEVTYGENGWHPHLHSLFFMSYELVGKHLEDLQARISTRYIAQLKKLGYSATPEHAIDVRTAESDIADYIAKFGREPVKRTWGADAEIALATVKKTHHEGLSPFDLLDVAQGESEALARLSYAIGSRDKQATMKRAGSLFCEYFHAFKGIARIHWGKNLREVLDLKTAAAEYDEQNPRESIEESQISMVQLDKSEGWQQLLKLPDGRAELRAVMRTGDIELVRTWLKANQISATIPEAAVIWQQQKRIDANILPERINAPKHQEESMGRNVDTENIPQCDPQHKPIFGATSPPASARGMPSE